MAIATLQRLLLSMQLAQPDLRPPFITPFLRAAAGASTDLSFIEAVLHAPAPVTRAPSDPSGHVSASNGLVPPLTRSMSPDREAKANGSTTPLHVTGSSSLLPSSPVPVTRTPGSSANGASTPQRAAAGWLYTAEQHPVQAECWQACLDEVLFPLLNNLATPTATPVWQDFMQDLSNARVLAIKLMCRIFLIHLPQFLELKLSFHITWLNVLNSLDLYMRLGGRGSALVCHLINAHAAAIALIL